MWAEETRGKPEGIILSPHLGPQFWPQKEAGEAQYREIGNWRVIRTWSQDLIRVPALQVRAKYQLFSKQGSVNDPCIKQPSLCYAIRLPVSRRNPLHLKQGQHSASKLCSLYNERPASSPSTWHMWKFPEQRLALWKHMANRRYYLHEIYIH